MNSALTFRPKYLFFFKLGKSGGTIGNLSSPIWGLPELNIKSKCSGMFDPKV